MGLIPSLQSKPLNEGMPAHTGSLWSILQQCSFHGLQSRAHKHKADRMALAATDEARRGSASLLLIFLASIKQSPLSLSARLPERELYMAILTSTSPIYLSAASNSSPTPELQLVKSSFADSVFVFQFSFDLLLILFLGLTICRAHIFLW